MLTNLIFASANIVEQSRHHDSFGPLKKLTCTEKKRAHFTYILPATACNKFNSNQTSSRDPGNANSSILSQTQLIINKMPWAKCYLH